MYRKLFKYKKLLVSTYKRGKNKTQEFTMDVLAGYNNLPGLIYTVYRIMVMEKHIMDILFGGNAQKEHNQHKAANDLDYLLSHLFLSIYLLSFMPPCNLYTRHIQ